MKCDDESVVSIQRVLIVAATTGYQTRMFSEAAERLGFGVLMATDRCRKMDDPWGDHAIPVRFEQPERAAADLAKIKPHPEGIVVLGPEGRIARYLFGASFDPADLRLALTEAGHGRTGSLSDRLLLLCYHFDPATGRYSARILDALRILIGLCGVGAAIFAWRIAWPRVPRGSA